MKYFDVYYEAGYTLVVGNHYEVDMDGHLHIKEGPKLVASFASGKWSAVTTRDKTIE